MNWWQWAIALAAILLAASVLAPARAEAAVSSCTLTTAGVAFSPYQTPTAVDGNGTISVECRGTNSNNTVSIHLTGGNNGACTDRVMRAGTGFDLIYNIYRTSARTSVFCNGASRLDLVFSFSGGLPQTQTVTLYGRVKAAQNPVYRAIAHTDSLTATARAGTSSTGTFLGSTSVPISGSVAAVCSVSAGTLGFGSYSGTAVNSTAAVSVNCSNGAPYFVSLGGGNNQSGSARRMAGPGGNFLSYQLYSDALRTIAWGDDSALLGARRGGTGSGGAQSLTVYGRIPAAQSPTPGSYSDSVVVTVEY